VFEFVGKPLDFIALFVEVQRWIGLSEQFRAFLQVDFRLDYSATIIGASALN